MIIPIRHLSLLTLFGLAVFAFNSTSKMSCNCTETYPQEIYCNAVYVIVVQVNRKYLDISNNTMGYLLKLQQIIKMPLEIRKLLDKSGYGYLRTSLVCGVNLSFKKVYLIAGQGPELNACDYVKDIIKMDNTEKTVLWGVYSDKCNQIPGKCY